MDDYERKREREAQRKETNGKLIGFATIAMLPVGYIWGWEAAIAEWVVVIVFCVWQDMTRH